MDDNLDEFSAAGAIAAESDQQGPIPACEVALHIRATPWRAIMRAVRFFGFILAGLVASAGAFSPQAKADGLRFAIYNNANNQCLDVYNFSTDPGAQVQSYACSGTTNQLWSAEVVSYDSSGDSFIRFVNVGSGLCLDLAVASSSTGVQTTQNTCGSTGTQMWKVSPPATTQTQTLNILGIAYVFPQSQTQIFRTVVNASSGLCLTTSGTNVVTQETCTSSNTTQLWRLPTF